MHTSMQLIFVACTAGKFGDKCAETCHCVNHPCDPVTGACPPGGCQTGFTCTSIDESTGTDVLYLFKHTPNQPR